VNRIDIVPDRLYAVSPELDRAVLPHYAHSFFVPSGQPGDLNTCYPNRLALWGQGVNERFNVT